MRLGFQDVGCNFDIKVTVQHTSEVLARINFLNWMQAENFEPLVEFFFTLLGL